MKRDVLSCFAVLGAAAGLASGGAPILGVGLALGGAFSALLKWGPTNSAAREAAFQELVAEMRAAGVASNDIDKLIGVCRDNLSHGAMLHAIFPELSARALASWLKDVERLDAHRLLDFGKLVFQLRHALNLAPQRNPDEVLRMLPVGYWVGSQEVENARQFDPSKVGVEKPLAMATREVLSHFYGKFRPTSVDPQLVRAAGAERAAVEHRDARAWIENNDTRGMDAGLAELALGNWQANAAQDVLRAKRDTMLAQQDIIKTGTQSRQLGRQARAIELQQALLSEHNPAKRDVLRRELHELKQAIGLWQLTKGERTAQHRQRVGLAPFAPPILPEPRRFDFVQDALACDEIGNGIFVGDGPLSMATSAAPRHGGALQSVSRALGHIGRPIGAFVASIFAPDPPDTRSADVEQGTPLAEFRDGRPIHAPADIEGAVRVVEAPQSNIGTWVAGGLTMTLGGASLYAGYEWLRSRGLSREQPSPASQAGRPAPALTSLQRALIDTLTGSVHANGNGTWGSTLDAITAILRGVPDPHAPQVIASVTEVLRLDFNNVAAVYANDFNRPNLIDGFDGFDGFDSLGDANDFVEFDVPDDVEVLPRRRLRRAVDASGTAQKLEQQRTEQAEDRATKARVVEIIDAVAQYQQSASANDEKLLFGALPAHWRTDPALDWLSRAPESEQKLWVHAVQKANDRFDSFSKAINDAQPLDGIYAAFANLGLDGLPAAWSVTYPVTIPGIPTPVTARQTLIEACLAGDTRRDPQKFEGFIDGVPASADQTRRMRELLGASECRTSSQERLTSMTSNIPSLKIHLAAFLESELHRDILEAKLKGHLTGGRDAWVRALDLMHKAISDAPDVSVGELRLAPPGMTEIALAPWLVFTDKPRPDADPNNCVVLYRPIEKTWSVFNSRQELFQYLDVARMRNALAGEMNPATITTGGDDALRLLPQVALESAAPRDRTALRKFFQTQAENPANWKPEYLRFEAYEGERLTVRMQAWAQRQLELHTQQLEPLAKVPGLTSQLVDAAALERHFKAYEDEHLPPLREFTRRMESAKLTRGLRGEGLSDLGEIDADQVFIDFNGRNMTVTDWVLEGYRGHGDNVLAHTNNFQLDAQISAENAEVAARLSSPAYKQSLESNLRATYAGDAFIRHLRDWLASTDAESQTFRLLTQAAIRTQLRVTLSQEIANGRIGQQDASWMTALVDGLPQQVASGDTFISEMSIGDRRIPGLLVFTQRKRSSSDTAGEVLRRDFVWLPEGPYGTEWLPLDEYRKVMHQSPYDDDLRERVLRRDRVVIDDALNHGQGVDASRVKTQALTDFASLSDRRLLDRISNAQESTTSRAEVIWGEVVKGLRYAAMPLCVATTGGAGFLLCGLDTAVLAGIDIESAVSNARRGDMSGALLDVAFLWADTLDIGQALRVVNPVRLLKWAGKAHFANAREVSDVLNQVKGQRAAFDDAGHLRDTLARHGIDIGAARPTPIRTGTVSGGVRYEHDGRDYIKDRGRVFEVFSDNAWSTVRVRDPQRLNGPGVPVTFSNGRWQWDDGGLLGGAPTSAKRPRIADPVNYLLDLGMSARDARVFLDAFVFPPGVEGSRRLALVQEMHGGLKVPDWARRYVRASERGQIFGIMGQTPVEVLGKSAGAVDSSLRLNRDQFEFPNAAMWDWFDLALSRRERPMWAAKYAKTVDGMFAPEEVLAAKGVFDSPEAADRYLSSFDALDASARTRLANDRMGLGRTPEWAYPYLRQTEAMSVHRSEGMTAEQMLVASGEFASDREVRDYLSQFDISAMQINGDAREWLAQRRLLSGSTPVELGQFLRTPIDTRKPASKMLVDAGIFPTQRAASEYLAKFTTYSPLRGKLSTDQVKQIALARILEGVPPAWSFERVQAEDVLALFGPNRIPRNIGSLTIHASEVGRLELPTVMPHLRTLRITGPIDLTLPVELPRIKSFVLKGVRVPREFSMPVAGRATDVVIDATNAHTIRIPYGCHGIRNLGMDGNSALRSVIVESAPPGAVNALNALPNVLVVEILNNRRLQEIELPLELPALTTLNLAGNDLTRFPVTSEHRMNTMRTLNVRNNRIATLGGLPHAPNLLTLNLDRNQFTNIPASVAGWRGENPTANLFARRLNVYLEENPIPEERITQWAARPQVNNDARIYFSMANPFADLAARPLADAVFDWFPALTQDAHRQVWEAFAKEMNAKDFSAFLDRLRRTVNFNEPTFRARVRKWLERLETDKALRDDTFPVSLCATASCEDRVTYAHGQMKQVLLASDAANGVYNDDPKLLRETMRGLFDLEVLERIAREKFRAMGGGDEIDVYLAYQVKLRGPLSLPTDATDMRYFAISGVTEADLVAAKARVLAEEKTHFDAYLSNSAPMQKAIKNKYPEAFAKAEDALTDITADAEAFEQRVKAHLKDTGMEDDADAIREAGPVVLRALTHEFYGPLVRDLLEG
ncbi:E3 ubiquitin-protein ligase ipaH3 [Pandoraea anapnoica]|uniref:E3 ubiquitin-protein ligase ipaH3 n=1 Tax=Pandoraea anapnoica TaxID=2508301 RepID=A0A5E4ZXI3_9BURK|nr:NEL-type E3 ubiquitin ligase domain-containing protein [Pandoraea anapnoica]VVE66024.1 E3 ubiquitin-protein ligase ipaH3 [Pandoraea anapnoica]